MNYRRSVYIFRRDLRLEDNTALNAALKSSKEVLPIFILDPRQVEPHPYRSLTAMHFMFESLRELDIELKQLGTKLYLFFGEAEAVLEGLLDQSKAEAVFINRDYTPFSTKRDEAIYELCKRKQVILSPLHDTLLREPKSGLKDDGTPYTVFTPFFKKNSKEPPAKPSPLHSKNFVTIPIPGSKEIDFLENLSPSVATHLFRNGGRKEGIALLESKLASLTAYNTERDLPSLDSTSGLSPHHKFGTVSVRETYWRACQILPKDTKFINELYWRDFFTGVGYFFPYVFGSAFQKRFNTLKWDDNDEAFQRWCDGETGFPIVDAGMRQLNETGFMHNRVRMIVSSFLIKDLHIDWRRGERYFATRLIDYDPAVNNGSWQWAASTGCDAQPYFRIFNPWLQQKKFDPKAEYIKRWIPELKDAKSENLHLLDKDPVSFSGYPSPMVNHSEEKKVTELRFHVCLGK